MNKLTFLLLGGVLLAGCSQKESGDVADNNNDSPPAVVIESEPTTTDSPVETASTEAKLNARDVLSQALAKGKSENKATFVHFTADW